MTLVGHQASMNSPGQGPAIFQLPALHKLPPKPVLQFIPKFNICIACRQVEVRAEGSGISPHSFQTYDTVFPSKRSDEIIEHNLTLPRESFPSIQLEKPWQFMKILGIPCHSHHHKRRCRGACESHYALNQGYWQQGQDGHDLWQGLQHLIHGMIQGWSAPFPKLIHWWLIRHLNGGEELDVGIDVSPGAGSLQGKDPGATLGPQDSSQPCSTRCTANSISGWWIVKITKKIGWNPSSQLSRMFSKLWLCIYIYNYIHINDHDCPWLSC